MTAYLIFTHYEGIPKKRNQGKKEQRATLNPLISERL